MLSAMEPTAGNVLLLSAVLIVSGVIILHTLRKLKMFVASTLFSVLFFLIGTYIPFYFLGTLIMTSVTVDSETVFSLIFLKHQLALLNAPFVLFGSVSLFIGIIALLSVIALLIATVFVVRVIIRAVVKARDYRFRNRHFANDCFDYNTYIPNYRNTYLVTGRLRN